ncbi:MAG: homogentisate 1,2-dioxygenase [Alphaproteobacteria bacterium]|nr:homogentisate 1,2-dioxygenase [Alphaproteobacteria bacterium]
MRRWIVLPRTDGVFSRQAHADLPHGTFEREIGREGFAGPATHVYHSHPPTGWVGWEGPLRPRAFDCDRLDALAVARSPAARQRSPAEYRFWRCAARVDHLVRNADGDDLLFVHAGAGDLFCDFGHLPFGDGDLVVLPRGTMWRIEPREPVAALLVEATGEGYALPERGLAGEHAIFDPAVLDVPALDDAFRNQQADEGEVWRVVIKRRGQLSTITYPYNPLDALGWKGTLVPVRLNWRDIRPLMSHRYHLPPSAHTQFVAERFVVSAFVPRPMESYPGALKVPFFHSNDDHDEVIFYHRGSFFSRYNIRAGMITLHPAGAPHGPHPKALQAGRQRHRDATDEVAVMIDACDALDVSAEASAVEWPGYVESWRQAAAG